MYILIKKYLQINVGEMKVFLSYKWEDLKFVNGLDGLLNNPNNIYRHFTKREKEDLRRKGEKAIRDYLRSEISDCDALICLVGLNTHSSLGVKYELEVAKSLGKKIIAVRIPNKKGGLPSLFKTWKIEETPWESEKIDRALI